MIAMPPPHEGLVARTEFRRQTPANPAQIPETNPRPREYQPRSSWQDASLANIPSARTTVGLSGEVRGNCLPQVSAELLDVSRREFSPCASDVKDVDGHLAFRINQRNLYAAAEDTERKRRGA